MAATTTMTMAPASVPQMRSDFQDDDDGSSLGNWTVVSDTPTVHASNVSEDQRRKVRSRIERHRQRQAVNEALEKAWISMSNVLFSQPTRWLDTPQQQDSIYPHPHSSGGGKPVKRTWGRTRLQ